ncbi:MAG: hypothetical protein GX638_08320 [Crenarchaeota archaeon]|nr:hypothetical protein [Thermoproteota archaeon]
MTAKIEEMLFSEINTQFISDIKVHKKVWAINAQNMPFKDLNSVLHFLDCHNAEKVKIYNVYGQRYIGTNLKSSMELEIHGTPGNDLAAFMNGPKITIHGNAQDCIANTMNEGQIVIHGRAGDITGYAMRGGKLFIKEDVGYRCGINMKEYQNKKPLIIVGGIAQDFLGEYMAGGTMIVLGMNLKENETHPTRYIGTGMHGGILYMRGKVTNISKEVKISPVDDTDLPKIEKAINEYCNHFNINSKQIMNKQFWKIIPQSHRPYSRIYA